MYTVKSAGLKLDSAAWGLASLVESGGLASVDGLTDGGCLSSRATMPHTTPTVTAIAAKYLTIRLRPARGGGSIVEVGWVAMVLAWGEPPPWEACERSAIGGVSVGCSSSPRGAAVRGSGVAGMPRCSDPFAGVGGPR